MIFFILVSGRKIKHNYQKKNFVNNNKIAFELKKKIERLST